MASLRARFRKAVVPALRGTVLTAFAAVAIALAGSALHAPSTMATPVDDDDSAKKAASPVVGEPGVVTIDRDAQAKGGIETAKPTPTTFRDEVRAYGTVLPLDRLVALYNAALTDAVQIQIAEVKQAESRAADARAKALLKAFSSAQAQAETAAAAAAIDTAGVAMAKAQMEALRNNAVLEWGRVLGDAIVARAQPATDLVAGRARLVQFSIQPGMIVAPPRRLSFALGGGALVEGGFVSEAAHADPKVQNVGYLYAVPAVAGLLPGTSVLAALPKGVTQPGVGIPSSAVVWHAGKPWLYLRTAPDRFERRPIGAAAAPTPDGGYVVPAKSLGSGQDKAIVTAGAQVLLSQEMRAQIPFDEDDN